MTFEKAHSAGFLANQMARLFATGLARRLQPIGLRPAQFMVLLELWEDDGLSQRALVERLDVEQATMANTLTRMERDGLISRHPDPDDKRARLIRLTDHARALERPAKEAAQAQNDAALAGLSQTQQEALKSAMTQVIATMRRTKG